jgi:ABC-2 type transport system permease protein
MTLLINRIRYFAIGDDFVAMGQHYVYTTGNIVLSFAGLVVFALIMYAFARWRFNKTVVT